jgi:hypothetical protein
MSLIYPMTNDPRGNLHRSRVGNRTLTSGMPCCFTMASILRPSTFNRFILFPLKCRSWSMYSQKM